jgi:type I restriction enzyme M protein
MPRGRRKAAAEQPKPPKSNGNGSSANLGFESQLWAAADKLRANMDAAEYKHVVLGLIFLKYISDAFEEHHSRLAKQKGADPEDRDEYTAERVFWVPKGARWSDLRKAAKLASIGKVVDDAMLGIERENPTLKGILPKDYAHPDLDKTRLGELIDLFSNLNVGGEEQRKHDVLGRVYEYFLMMFAAAEGRLAGQFYTPSCVVRLLVAMIEPYKGRVYDPCCGSGGMFVQAERFVEAHHGRIGDISVYGQESNPGTWRLARMNLALRGIEADLGPHHADTFHRDLHPDLKADYVLANPHFNDSDWGGQRLREDARWKYGVPPVGNANFAWVQHFLHHLAPKGVAGFVLANGSMSSQQSGEGDIRRAIVEADLVDAMISLPDKLFYTTGIAPCLWFLRRGRAGTATSGRTLFLDCRKMGTLIDRTHRELYQADLDRIAGVYHAWRSGRGYRDEPGFAGLATTAEVTKRRYILTPGPYVGAADVEDDEEPFDQKLTRLTRALEEQFAEGARVQGAISRSLRSLNHGR